MTSTRGLFRRRRSVTKRSCGSRFSASSGSAVSLARVALASAASAAAEARSTHSAMVKVLSRYLLERQREDGVSRRLPVEARRGGGEGAFGMKPPVVQRRCCCTVSGGLGC